MIAITTEDGTDLNLCDDCAEPMTDRGHVFRGTTADPCDWCKRSQAASALTTPADFFVWDDLGECWRLVRLSAARPVAEFTSGGPTDEGYSRSWERYTLTADGVDRELATDARDCDGRSSWSQEDFASFGQLAVRAPCDDSPAWLRLPEWSPRSQSQRDYSAEAAGY